MKKILLLVLLLTPCFLAFNSCSDDDDPVASGSLQYEWKGDWNDPTDPGYIADYNPIEGRWRRVDNPFRWLVCQRAENGKLYMSFYADRGTAGEPVLERVNRYAINDEAYMLYDTNDRPLAIWLYEVDENYMLLQMAEQGEDGRIYEYRRENL